MLCSFLFHNSNWNQVKWWCYDLLSQLKCNVPQCLPKTTCWPLYWTLMWCISSRQTELNWGPGNFGSVKVRLPINTSEILIFRTKGTQVKEIECNSNMLTILSLSKSFFLSICCTPLSFSKLRMEKRIEKLRYLSIYISSNLDKNMQVE